MSPFTPLAACARPASACLARAPPPRLRRIMPGRRNYGKLSGNRCLQDRSSHMPPPAPLGTGDAWAEAAQSTNSCSRRHGKYLFCFAAIVQVLLNLLGLHSMLTMVPRKRITTPAPPAAHVPRAAPAPRAAPGSFSCSGSSGCSGLLRLCALLLLHALTI